MLAVAFMCVSSSVCNNGSQKREKVIPPGIEPGTLSVLDSRDNRYTMESAGACNSFHVCVEQCVHCGSQKREKVIPPGIEPGTLNVLDSRDNHYTMASI